MINPTDHVYLSGPMAGIKDENKSTFHEVETMIRERYGCNVINPAYLSELMGHDRSWEHYLTVDLALVRTSTVMILLEGWEHSPGARQEAAEAVICGLKIIKYEDIEAELGQSDCQRSTANAAPDGGDCPKRAIDVMDILEN